jgi:6-phosphogluconolactonase
MNATVLGSVAVAASTLTGCAGEKPDTFRVYFGTSAKDEQRGIYMAELDMKTGTLSDAVRVSKAMRPGFIAIDSSGKHIYATGAGSTFEGRAPGVVSAFSILENGMLADLNSQPSGGAGPTHVSLDPSGNHLLVANYRGASCSVLPIRPDGALAPPSSTRVHTGSSIHPDRQTQAYTHSINTSPDGRFAFAADLGMDKIMIYRFDPTTGKLEPNDPAFTKIEQGGGPRHFTFHPTGKFAYVSLELSNKVTAFTYDTDKGTLNETQTVSTLPEGYRLPNTTAEVITSADGRFLYVSNRGHDSIAIFSIDAETGLLTLLDRESVRGQIPRNFNIDPTGTFLVVANQKTSNVVVFKIDRKTGLIAFTGSEIKVPSPICVRFLAAP